ncbi:Cell division control protein 48-like B [Vitis vinifera]|uniref:Cell division control protein 48-like B n=1 Tax=Vitis vinifera TaxID=29760 RepID=A0A438EU77_VITVI|nr:Cell division control protein 48-like B [Vitis vinifera]
MGHLGVGLWKEIMKEADWCWNNMTFKVGKGTKIRFWKDTWCGDVELARRFPQLFSVAAQKGATVGDLWDQNAGQGEWNLRFLRSFNDWELPLVEELLQILRNQRINLEEDLAVWKGGIWVENVPSKLAFFAWEATWGRILTIDRLQREDGKSLTGVTYVVVMRENVSHLLIHCTVASVLWGMTLSLFGAQWVFPETVKETSLVRAVVRECGAHLTTISPHTVHRAHAGESERILREAFSEASSHAVSGKPSVIFIDEIDALCPRRSSRRCTRNVPKCTLGSKGQSQHPPGNPVGQGEHWEDGQYLKVWVPIESLKGLAMEGTPLGKAIEDGPHNRFLLEPLHKIPTKLNNLCHSLLEMGQCRNKCCMLLLSM